MSRSGLNVFQSCLTTSCRTTRWVRCRSSLQATLFSSICSVAVRFTRSARTQVLFICQKCTNASAFHCCKNMIYILQVFEQKTLMNILENIKTTKRLLQHRTHSHCDKRNGPDAKTGWKYRMETEVKMGATPMIAGHLPVLG